MAISLLLVNQGFQIFFKNSIVMSPVSLFLVGTAFLTAKITITFIIKGGHFKHFYVRLSRSLSYASVDHRCSSSVIGSHIVRPILRISQGDSLRQIPFSHGTFLRHNGAQERSIIQFTDLHSYWLSLRVI